MRAVKRFFVEIFGTLLDIVLPCRCIICGTIVDPGGGNVCRVCRDRLAAEVSGGPGAWKPFVRRLEDSGNRAGFHRETVVSGGSYRGDLRRLIIAFKFQGRRTIGRLLAGRIARVIKGYSGNNPELIIPVPLFRERLRQRGFNQAGDLGRELAELMGIQMVEGVLERMKKTDFQTRLDSEGRWRNVEGVFMVTRPQEVKDKRVLLVDDLYTTGATVVNCAKALMEAGAAEVYVATAAMAPHPGKEQ